MLPKIYFGGLGLGSLVASALRLHQFDSLATSIHGVGDFGVFLLGVSTAGGLIVWVTKIMKENKKDKDEGGAERRGEMYAAIGSLKDLPSEIGRLSTGITVLSERLGQIPTRENLNEGLKDNRHDLRNLVAGSIGELALKIEDTHTSIGEIKELVRKSSRARRKR